MPHGVNVIYSIACVAFKFLFTFLCRLSAVAFKNAKQLEEAKDAYLQEAEAHTNNRTYPFTSRWMTRLNVYCDCE